MLNAQHLSERLMRVAAYVNNGAVVADIGSDHAYLPCYLIHHQIASKAIAGEVAKGPFESAQGQVQAEQLQERINVRFANGLKAIEPEDDVDTVTIAGMGGPLIATILDQDMERLATVTRLILQPNVYAKAIREWAQNNGWRLIAEEILQEDDKIYEILVLEKGAMDLSPAQKILGPFLMENQNEVFKTKWRKESAEWKRILESIRSAELSKEVQMKKAEVEEKLEIVMEALGE